MFVELSSIKTAILAGVGVFLPFELKIEVCTRTKFQKFISESLYKLLRSSSYLNLRAANDD
jgi:hypothetical protein